VPANTCRASLIAVDRPTTSALCVQMSNRGRPSFPVTDDTSVPCESGPRCGCLQPMMLLIHLRMGYCRRTEGRKAWLADPSLHRTLCHEAV
jgi:hypothetical protein